MTNNQYTCLMFHEIVEDKPINRFSVKFDTFAKYLDIIQEAGFATLSNKQLDVATGQKSVLLTFDDGHRSNVRAADMLSERGMTGVFFIVKDFSTNRAEDYMTVDEIKYIHSLGHIIGVHGKMHDSNNHWSKLPPKQLISDLSEVKDWLEQITSEEVNICSAPGGIIDDKTFRNIEENLPGLKYIRSSCPMVNKYGITRLGSTGIRYTTSFDDYENRLKGNALTYMKIRGWYEMKRVVRPVYNLIRRD